uniref:DUF551 domain-containing protein n=1 Tax=Klebsiella sp. TaxID=576 RepID=UPI00257FBEC0|nr:DUF551 domain-containing protein [Klebsiella sp.]
MTSKFTREQLIEKLKHRIAVTEKYPHLEEAQIDSQIFKIALAAMDSEPVGEFYEDGPLNWYQISDGDRVPPHRRIPLYRHAQPAPEKYNIGDTTMRHIFTPTGMNNVSNMQAVFDRVEAVLVGMEQPAPVVPDESYQQLSDLYHAQEKRLFKIAQRIKGSAFDKYSHSPSQAIDVLEAAIFGDNDACRAAMLQAQSEDDDGEPTDDERIMAIEGIHNCERCGDEGWIVGEMGITSCACGQAGTLINEGTIQAGNSPVITGAEQRIADAVELLQKAAPAMLADNSGPDGPLAGRLKSPVIPDGSAYMLRRWLAFGRGMQNAGSQLPHNLIAETESMLAAAPKPQNSPQNIPEIIPGWIPVSERMPKRGDYLVTDGRDFDVQTFDGEQFIPGFVWDDVITHWMPLPAAPQEAK